MIRASAVAALVVGCGSSPIASAPRDSQACGSCHAQEQHSWQESLHHASFSDADFQSSFAHEPLDFCVGCHAPEASSRKDAAGLARGVGCVSCHQGVREPVAGHHPARSTSVPCARCHEFDFPERPLAMQSTETEHRALGFAATPCPSCHMAGASHRFDVTRNPTWLRAALEPVEIVRGDGNLAITLRTHRVGHAMPTGDLFRRLRLSVRVTAGERVVLQEERMLGKRYSREQDQVDDTRIFTARTETFRVDAPPGSSVHVLLVYERVAFATDHDARLYGSVVLADATYPL